MSRVFFTDRDLGRQFPDILEKSGLSVERHASHFACDCPDETWLQVVGERGWVALTHDQRIRYKKNESDAVIRHRVTLLVIVGKAPHRDLAHAFVATLPRIEAFLTNALSASDRKGLSVVPGGPPTQLSSPGSGGALVPVSLGGCDPPKTVVRTSSPLLGVP